MTKVTQVNRVPFTTRIRADLAPFDTYHTARDSGGTLDAGALERVARVLDAIVALGG